MSGFCDKGATKPLEGAAMGLRTVWSVDGPIGVDCGARGSAGGVPWVRGALKVEVVSWGFSVAPGGGATGFSLAPGGRGGSAASADTGLRVAPGGREGRSAGSG